MGTIHLYTQCGQVVIICDQNTIPELIFVKPSLFVECENHSVNFMHFLLF